MWLKRISIVLAAFIPVAVVGAFVMKSPTDNAGTDSTPLNSAPTIPTEEGAGSAEDSAVLPAEAVDDDIDANTGADVDTTSDTTIPSSAPTETTTEVVNMYANGTYTAEGAYTSPAGAESLTVSVTVDADHVSAVTVVPHGTGASAVWQEKFISGVDALVVGKDLSELRLANVSGSSLTPVGFNAAFASIRAQAKI